MQEHGSKGLAGAFTVPTLYDSIVGKKGRSK